MKTAAVSCVLLLVLAVRCVAGDAMEHAVHGGHGMDEDPVIAMVLVDRLEAGRTAGASWAGWDAKLWWGTDHSRWQLRSEGHDAVAGHSADATWEAGWLRPVSPWMQMSLGAVRDVRGTVARNGLSAGVAGVLPYRVALQSAVWLVEGGRAVVRLELEQDWLLTQRWSVQPRLESRLWTDGQYSQELGIRLRFEVRRELAPYVGLLRSLGREPGQSASADNRIVAGLRVWY